MITFLEKITSSENSLLLYKYNLRGFSMSKEKQVKTISAGLKITESEDERLKKLSSLTGETKFMRGRMAHKVFELGLQCIEDEVAKVHGELKVSHIISVTESKEGAEIARLTSLLKKHGLLLEIKEIHKEDT